MGYYLQSIADEYDDSGKYIGGSCPPGCPQCRTVQHEDTVKRNLAAKRIADAHRLLDRYDAGASEPYQKAADKLWLILHSNYPYDWAYLLELIDGKDEWKERVVNIFSYLADRGVDGNDAALIAEAVETAGMVL